jgi:hypothetical protein
MRVFKTKNIMAIKIRNRKTQEERVVTQELWDKMRTARKDWYAVSSEEGAKEAPVKPAVVRVAPKRVEPDTATAVLPEN